MPVPAAPTNLTATAIDAGQVDLSWDDNESWPDPPAATDVYYVERRPFGTFAWELDWGLVETLQAPASSWTDNFTPSETALEYRVSASNSSGSSPLSNVAEVTTPAAPELGVSQDTPVVTPPRDTISKPTFDFLSGGVYGIEEEP